MQKLVRGSKMKMDVLAPNLSFQVKISMPPIQNADIDISCFGVDEQQQLSDDRYFIFFNQLSSPEGAITKQDGADIFTIALKKLPASINKLVFTASIDGTHTMNQIQSSQLSILDNASVVAEYAFAGGDFQNQKAIILAEIYLKNNEWRFSIVGQGFDGGLDVLLTHFGGAEEPAPAPAPATKISLTKSEKVEKIVLEKAPRLVDLTKKVNITLEKKKLSDLVAKVLLVLDASGSMNAQYRTGRVQRILDKALPLALHFDDDYSLESWAFATTFKQLDDATIDNIDGYIDQVNGGWRKWDIGGTNNEPAVMESIYLKHKDSTLPVYVIFISDGGVSQNKKIKDIITTAAYAPIFWQFIGISGHNYGALEKLDDLRGRYVDNANFFALDDIDAISDQELYNRMMNEFPMWLKAAKEKNIL